MSAGERILFAAPILLLCVACSSNPPPRGASSLPRPGEQDKTASASSPSQPQPPVSQNPTQTKPTSQQPPANKDKQPGSVSYATNPERFVKEKTVEPAFNITDPKTADEHLSVAIFDDNKQQWDKAIEEYTKALELRPDWALAHFRLAKDYQRKGRAEDAIAQLQEATRSDPQYYEAYYHLALAYKDRGRTREAIQAYTKFMEYPNAGIKMLGQYQLGLWYEETGDREQAIEHLQSYRRLAVESKTAEPRSDRFRKALLELQKLKSS
jgi:tetratricopeptide (TPR) repeat protein